MPLFAVLAAIEMVCLVYFALTNDIAYVIVCTLFLLLAAGRAVFSESR